MGIYTRDDLTPAVLQRRTSAGLLQRIVNGVYSDDTTRTPEQVVTREWRAIVGKVMPGAVVSYANAFDGNPRDGEVNVAHPRRRPLELPGLTVRPDMVGRRDLDDVPFGNDLWLASTARALVDNSADHRGRPTTRVQKLTREQLHNRIVQIVNGESPDRVDRLIDQVRQRAPGAVGDGIAVFFAAARAEVHTVDTPSRAMRAAQLGEGYDHARVSRFRSLVTRLQAKAPVLRYNTGNHSATVPFFEAYFSNFIEGTEFTVEEAQQIVYQGIDLGRPRDAHDIAGTYQILTSDSMRDLPRDADDFLDSLRDRHAAMMRMRPEVLPGQWKDRSNRAGTTEFVPPDLVAGTLRAGWEEAVGLDDPFRRATYLMFLVCEVHPFVDGNGRSARVAMNNQLVAAAMHRIIVPTIQRNSYLDTLTRASNDGGPDGLYTVLDHAQRWVAAGDWSTIATGLAYCHTSHALVPARQAEAEHLHLEIPEWQAVHPPSAK